MLRIQINRRAVKVSCSKYEARDENKLHWKTIDYELASSEPLIAKLEESDKCKSL